jgi:hypothetical protein
MSRADQHAEVTYGYLRAVAYSQVDVSVYDDAVDPTREVWHCKTLEEAKVFMLAVNPYLAVFKADALGRTPETKAQLKTTFDEIPEREWQSRALTIAFRRYEGDPHEGEG